MVEELNILAVYWVGSPARNAPTLQIFLLWARMGPPPFADQGGDAARISDGSAWSDVSRHRFAEPCLILLVRTARHHHLGGKKLGAASIAWVW